MTPFLLLLFWVCVLAVVYWVISQIAALEPFRPVIYGILVIALLWLLFTAARSFPAMS